MNSVIYRTDTRDQTTPETAPPIPNVPVTRNVLMVPSGTPPA